MGLNKIKIFILFIINIFIMFLMPNLILKAEAATAITSSGGSLSSGEYYLTADTILSSTITISSGQTVTIDLKGYLLQGTGSGYVINNKGNLTIIDSNPDSTHKGNLNSNGAWLSNSSGSLLINGGIICNKAGYMCIMNSNNLTITGGTITGSNGNLGAITNSSNAFLEMTGGKVKYNYCNNEDYGGAAIFANPSVNGNSGATITLSNVEITNNKTVGSGGAIFAGGTTKIANSIISNNTATINGGAIVSTKSEFEISNSTVSNNIASQLGGAIQLNYGGSILNETVISNNTGSSGAGGVRAEAGELKVDKSTITGNVAKSASGGGIFITQDASLELTNSEISYNSAPVYGGGIYSAGNMNISDTSIIYNQAAKDSSTATGSGRGGGLCLSATNSEYPAHTELTNVIINNNEAMYYGGGIHLSGAYASITLNSGTISHNKAYLGGAGAVHVTGSSTFTMINGSKMEYNETEDVGGAIHSSYGCTINLRGGIIQYNKVIGRGGGINVNVGGILNLEGSTIQNNQAVNGYVHDFAKYENGKITYIEDENTKKTIEGRGGGVVIDSGEFTMNSGIISNNFAGTSGGGIALIMLAKRAEDLTGNKVVQFTINGGTIENNQTDGDGGGIYLMENSFKNSTYADIPDELRFGIPTFTATGGIIRNNTAKENGGAAYLNTDTKFVMDGNAIIDGNQAQKNGGAVYISTGEAEIKSGNMINNKAQQDGGAIYINGTATIADGTIKNNTAQNGAGIYISNGNLNMSGGEISNNLASKNGGGIYASSNETDLTVTITSGKIIGNVASLNGGGVGVNMGPNLEGIVTVGLSSCKGENINHIHPEIGNNTANANGGGFWLNGDNMTMNMYCGSVKENLAIVEPGSANIYQTGGTATVFAGDIGDGVIVIGGKYEYIPENQIPEMTIIYDSNNPDNREQKTAQVTTGVGIYLPKNLFKREGYVLVGWAHIPNPTQNDTIYSVGEPYIVGNSNITIYAIWLLEGSGNVETPGIEIGKEYFEVTNGTNIIMSSNASFTTQMLVSQIQPSYYKNRVLEFDKNIPKGTNITMIDVSNPNERKYYSYQVFDNNTKIINLSEFTKNGTTEKFVNSISTELTNESFMFIVEFPENNEETGARQVTLIRNPADSRIAPIEQTTTYTLTKKREFKLDYESDAGLFEKPTIENTIKISYSSAAPIGDDTRYKNKVTALKITAAEGYSIPRDASIYDGTNYYEQNGKGEVIVPLGDINLSKEIDLKLNSDILARNQIGCNLKVELLVSRDATKPSMGEVVAEIENIELEELEFSAVKLDIDKYAFTQSEFENSLEVNYKTLMLENFDVTLEFQKKDENGIYETRNNILSEVQGKTENINGIFNLELNSSGKINFEFVDGFENQKGTYRILLKASDESDNYFEEVCGFLITE